MTDTRCKIIVRPKDIAWNDGSKEIAMLLEVSSIRDVDQSFGIAVAKVGRVRWPVVDLYTIRIVLVRK